jgi:hypothetical protein
MAKLSEIVSILLCDIVLSRSNADKYSAHLSLEYEKDEILRHFPVPRIEISELTVNLKFAVIKVDKDIRNAEIIIEADKLREIKEESISSINLVTNIRNYAWTRTDLDSKKYSLVETS